MFSAGHLAEAHHALGKYRKAEDLRREMLAGWRRVRRSESHYDVLEAYWLLALACGDRRGARSFTRVEDRRNETGRDRKNVDEAREIRDALLPVVARRAEINHYARRMQPRIPTQVRQTLGSEHHITKSLQHADFLTPITKQQCW